MLKTLSDAISVEERNVLSHTPRPMSDYVEHVADLNIDDDLSKSIEDELISLQLKSSSSKIKTQWLSPSNESYNYGNVINNAKPISSYPNICKLMAMVNDHPSTTGDLDACLVSCFSTSKATLNLHADGEKLISQESSIATVSFGPPRKLEFVRKGKKAHSRNSKIPADLTLEATDRTMNVMKPGAQSNMKHRVPQGTHIKAVPDVIYSLGSPNIRYSLSFRRIVTTDSEPEPASDIFSTAPHPEEKSTDTSAKKPTHRKPIVLIAGDSFPNRLDAHRLAGSRKKQTVVNIAKGGSTIIQVENEIKDFVFNNPGYFITKLIVSVGTNDCRHCRSKEDCKQINAPLRTFMKCLKEMLPDTKIWFQSLLPIVNGGEYTTRNVYEMNNIIFQLCSKYNIFFLDVFNSFIDYKGYRDDRLFPKLNLEKPDIHPNKRGLGVLARRYIFIIRTKFRFNPLGY